MMGSFEVGSSVRKLLTLQISNYKGLTLCNGNRDREYGGWRDILGHIQELSRLGD